MFKNYFRIALRNFWRNKVFSLINILGLSIGISASLVIFLLVHHEFTFDRFEPQRDRIYRVGPEEWWPGSDGFRHSGCLPAPMGPAIQKDMTGIDLVVPFT